MFKKFYPDKYIESTYNGSSVNKTDSKNSSFPSSALSLSLETSFLSSFGASLFSSMSILSLRSLFPLLSNISPYLLFSNIANYAYPNKEGFVDIALKIHPDEIEIQFKDNGIPYNPLAREDPDITLSVEERGVGGLGIYMVKKSMDEVAYEYTNGQNIFTMVKNF